MGVEEDTEPVGCQRHRASGSGVNFRASDVAASGRGLTCPLLKSESEKGPKVAPGPAG